MVRGKVTMLSRALECDWDCSSVSKVNSSILFCCNFLMRLTKSNMCISLTSFFLHETLYFGGGHLCLYFKKWLLQACEDLNSGGHRNEGSM